MVYNNIRGPSYIIRITTYTERYGAGQRTSPPFGPKLGAYVTAIEINDASILTALLMLEVCTPVTLGAFATPLVRVLISLSLANAQFGGTCGDGRLWVPDVLAKASDRKAVFQGGLFEELTAYHDLASQTEFVVIFPHAYALERSNKYLLASMPPEPRPVFRYSNGDWSMDRYLSEITKLAEAREYVTRTFKFDNRRDYLVSISQGVAQDVFYLAEDVEAIRKREVQYIFLRTSEDTDDKASEFRGLVWHNLDKEKYGQSLTRLLNGRGAQLGVAFNSPPAPEPSGENRDRVIRPARLEGIDKFGHRKCDFVMMVRRPTGWDPGFNVRNHPIKAYKAYEAADKDVYPGIFVKFDAGVDIAKRRVNEAQMALAQDEVFVPSTASAFTAFTAPLAGGAGPASAAGDDAFDTNAYYHQQLMHYLLATPPLPSSGDADPNDLTAALCNLDIRDRHFALPYVRIDEDMDGTVCEACLMGLNTETTNSLRSFFRMTRLGLVPIIGFAGSGKTQTLTHTATVYMFHRTIGKLHCSVPTHVATTNFAGRLFGMAEKARQKLGPEHYKRQWTDNSVHINTQADTDPYRSSPWQFKLSACFWLWEAIKYPEDQQQKLSPDLLAIRLRMATSPKYYGFCRFDNGGVKVSFSEVSQSLTLGESESLHVIVKKLLGMVIMAADAGHRTLLVIGTTSISTVDALQVWGYSCRPCAMAGDEKQLPPAVMTAGHTKDGKILNAFAQFAKVSVLEQIKRTGWPCLVLTCQRRIVSGGFDIAKEVIYKEIGHDEFSYGDRTSSETNPEAQKIKTWLVNKYRATTSPQGKVLPMFFHCPDIVIVTPYQGNLEQLEAALRSPDRQPERAQVKFNTTDSFRAREGLIVIFILVITAAMGPLLVAGPHRICVGLIRHKGALFIVGGITTVSSTSKDQGWSRSLLAARCKVWPRSRPPPLVVVKVVVVAQLGVATRRRVEAAEGPAGLLRVRVEAGVVLVVDHATDPVVEQRRRYIALSFFYCFNLYLPLECFDPYYDLDLVMSISSLLRSAE
ncbi:hypothetical protein QBC46DRAFT_426539 [Diplogelasinospora grovesii]|uniref:DNA2/NAM7 helicase-like C-terminal domain-containing protein n=1 Tax=Diplogelasinospora grovesii TaxID=303347 RepID=A0AAN6MX86_9PEZI|nr:hypothetical protein QBC46DRAFT_426539 [Diplogelasinospora grovesii]